MAGSPQDATFDDSRPQVARVYDYLLGGTENSAADRAAGDRIIAALPDVQVGVRAQRAVLGRVVRYLVADAGVRQLLDIGSGLPTADNVHQIAQRIDPAARVVYVDNDPAVVAQARALLADNASATAAAGDLREPAGILAHPDVRTHLDWDQPIGLLLCGIVHYIPDEQQPAELIATLARALPSGSYVFIHHLRDSPDPAAAGVQAAMRQGLGPVQFRTQQQIRDLFGGLDLVEPGVVPVPEWHPDPGAPDGRDRPVLQLACVGVARKP